MILATDTVRPLQWTDEGLLVLDQRALPDSLEYDLCESAADVAEAISTMRVRGAPAIGIAAAYGVVLSALDRFVESPSNWKEAMEADLVVLAQSRPTAVNLFWAINRMRTFLQQTGVNSPKMLLAEAIAIHEADIIANRRMGALGAAYLGAAKGVLTHCNTGSLATGGFGTALGVIRSAQALAARDIFATETRPWAQGARLTVWELGQDDIPATLIADSAAAFLMSSGHVQWVIVGADRIAANGDTANKIGTYALAVAALHHGVRFMVVAPTSTIDWQSPSGSQIEIEERSSAELLSPGFLTPDSVIKAWNPVFDVTPAAMIDVIVTEKGCVEKPTLESMRQLLA